MCPISRDVAKGLGVGSITCVPDMAEELDLDDELFIHPLPDYLKCPICLCCLRFPFQTPCGHRFCKECILPILNSRQNTCPKDRTIIDTTNTFPDNAVRLQINSLQIKCPKHADGCKWKGELSDSPTHLKTCSFVDVPCELCVTKLKRKYMDTHARVCPKRSVTCEHCKVELCFSDLSTHNDTCKEFPVPCRYACQTEPILRKDLEAHYQSTCPKVPVPCQMAPFGCGEQVERGQMTGHLAKCAPQYTVTLAASLLKLQEEVKELRGLVAQQQEQLRATSSTLYPCAGQFTWKLEDIQHKVKVAQAGDPLEAVMYSPPFFSSEAGYKLCLCVYPAGDSNQGYLSLYFVVMRGPYDEIVSWPFQKRIHLSLLSCRGGQSILKDIQPDPHLHYFHRPENPRNVGYGYPKFISLQRLLAADSEFLENGCIFIRCKIYD